MQEIKLTPEAFEFSAAFLAEATNGGSWSTHYTEAQRNLWRQRLAAALSKQ